MFFTFSFKIVQLGVALSEVEDGSQRIKLYYTDPGTQRGSQVAASFKMGDLTGRWARFTLTVQGSEVSGSSCWTGGENQCVTLAHHTSTSWDSV